MESEPISSLKPQKQQTSQNPQKPQKPLEPFELSDLTSFSHFTSFNLFIFSRTSTNIPLFLLHSPKKSTTFSHWSGIFDKHDPNIYFSVIREFISQNRGLLNSRNFRHLLADTANPSAFKDILLEKDLTGPVRPQKGFTTPIDEVCKFLSETPYIFQDHKGCVTYFVEFPLLSLEAINEIAEKRGLKFSMNYYTLEEIVDTTNQEISKQLRQSVMNSELVAYAQTFIVDSEPIEITEHYAIISCEPNVDTYMMHGLHYPIYKKHGEQWRFYKAFEGEFPTDEEIKSFKGVLIPGSSCSAYASRPWYKKLFEVICKIVNSKNPINFLLICFGAQIVAEALGGKVERMDNPFIRGADTLIMKPSFYKNSYIKDARVHPAVDLVIGQSHGDHIVKLPKGAVLQGSSERTKVECYTIGDNVLAFQGHPEYNEAWTAGAYYRVKGMEGKDYDRFANDYMKETFSEEITRRDLTKICYTFLKKDNQ